MKMILRNCLAVLVFCLTSGLAIAQTAGLLPNGMQQFSDANGTPYAAGSVTFYIPSTTTPKTTWIDPNQGTPNANPVILDASGRATIYGSGQYRQILKDLNGNTIWDKLTYGLTLPTNLVTGPGSATVGDLACWGNSAGTALTDCGNLLSGNHVWTGSNYFGNGYPWVDIRATGAVGNGATDDASALRTAITTIAALGGGEVYIPPGTYCIKSTENIASGAVRIVGAGQDATTLSTCGADITMFDMNTFHVQLEQLTILGKGAPTNVTGGFAATVPAVRLDSACIECLIEDVTLYGGATEVRWSSAEAYVSRLKAAYSYSNAVVQLVSGAGGWLMRDKLDQPWPGGAPNYGTTLNAWAGATAYSLGTVVSSQGYYLQCTHAGTSASGQPTLLNYGVAISDGSAIWTLVGPTSLSALNLDTGVSEVYAIQLDATGAYSQGIWLTNSLLGAAPQIFRCVQCIVSQAVVADIQVDYGEKIYVDNAILGGCITTGCDGLKLASTWGGNLTWHGGEIEGIGNGIAAAGSAMMIVNGVDIISPANDGIFVAGVSAMTLTGNVITNAGVAAIVTSGTMDYYNIIGNICQGSVGCVTDGGSGTNKTISGNH